MPQALLAAKPYSCAPAWRHTAGPRDARVVLVGEAFGENEELLGRPFVGWSGYELSKMLAEAGLTAEPALKPEHYSSLMLMGWWERQGLLLTNVFAFRPPGDKLNFICGKKAEVGGKAYKHESIGKEGYVKPEYLGELARLRTELEAHPRNVVIALGAKAAWGLLGTAKISKIRGVATGASLIRGLKVIPTYHPAGVLRNWAWRPIAVADFLKVRNREMLMPEVIRPEREVIVNPTLAEVCDWMKRPTWRLGVDLETKARQIEMVGLARSRSDALVIPLIDPAKPGASYWSQEDEREVWSLLRWRLEDASIEKVFQNGLYDLQYFVRRSPIRPLGCAHDTMLLHHSIFPELQKGLGFLGSLYTNEASWKLWRGKEAEELKRDE